MKYFNILIICYCLCFSSVIYGQTWQWAKGQMCGGGLHGGDGGMSDGWICKTDIHNNIYVGGIFSGGNFGDSACFDSYQYYRPASSSNIIVNKYDSLGNVLWSIMSSDGYAFPYGITTDQEGNMYLYGYFGSDSIKFGTHLITNPYYNAGQNTNNNSSYFVLKFDFSGNIIWHKTGGNIAPTGSLLSQGGITSDAIGNIYICGSFWDSSIQIGSYSLINTHDSTCDFFVAKYDSMGNVLWAKSFGGTGDDMAIGIVVTPKGYPTITGTFKSRNLPLGSTVLHHFPGAAPALNNQQLFITRLSYTGLVLWAKESEGSGAPYCISIDQSRNVYVGGEIYDTSIFILGSFRFNNTYLYASGFLSKYNENGDVLWAKIFAPFNSVRAIDRCTIWGLTNDLCNNVWMSGVIINSTPIKIDSLTTAYPPPGQAFPGIFAGYNSDGNLLRYSIIESVEDDNTGLSADKNGNIYLSGDVTARVKLDTTQYWGTAAESMYLAKYSAGLSCKRVDVADIISIPQKIAVYPNPAYTELTISSIERIFSACISNMSGQIVYKSDHNAQTIQIDIAHLPKGVYIIRINGTEARKFIKE